MPDKKDNFIDLGLRIREVRKSCNLSQELLAEKADVGTTHISHIETACTKLSLKTFIRIANALNVSADELLCDYINNSSHVYKSELTLLIKDCNDKETRLIYDIVKYTIYALRNRDFT